MDAVVLDGRKISKDIISKIKNRTKNIFEKKGICPELAVITVGDNPASLSYIKSIKRQSLNAGINFSWGKLKDEATESQIIDTINQFNRNTSIDGIMVQLPLPDNIDVNKVRKSISPYKDVDCFNPINTGKLFLGEKVLPPCTPKGTIKLIEESGIELTGRKAVVVSRSNIVGKPVALLLLKKNCTVTICHSKTRNLKKELLSADIIISATGKPVLIKGNMVSEGTIVIDVGTSMVNGKIVGDVDYEEVRKKASYITPVPGGVGAMTTAMLLENTLEVFKNIHEHSESIFHGEIEMS